MKPEGYKWDGDSRDERESEMNDSAFSSTQADADQVSSIQRRLLREHKRGVRIRTIVWVALIALAAGALLLYAFAHRGRG